MEGSLRQSQLERLHEYCGYCGWKYHKTVREVYYQFAGKIPVCSCGNECCNANNHSFRNEQDLIALGKRIIEKGEWEEFYDYAFDLEIEKDYRAYPSKFFAWLIFQDDSRLAQLFCEFKGWE